MASFRKRAGKWQAQIRRAGQAVISKTFDLKEDAQRWARLQERLCDTGEINPPITTQTPERITLAELLDRYRSEVLPQKRSAGPIEEFHLRAVAHHPLSKRELHQIEPSHIAEYRDHRLLKVSGSTVRRELGLLQHAFNVASREWGIAVPEMRHVSKPPANKARVKRLSQEELKRLNNAFDKCRNQLVKPTVLFALATGMRRSEVLALRWKDINLQHNTAFLEMTKNGESRTVPLCPKALGALKLLSDIIGDDKDNESFVFPISANGLRLAWTRVIKRAGVDDLRFHDLRHEAISHFFELGLSVPEVSLVSGHKDPRMLARYTHLRACEVAAKLHVLTSDPQHQHANAINTALEDSS